MPKDSSTVADVPQRVALDLMQHAPDHVAIRRRLAIRRPAPFAAGTGQDVEDHCAAADLVRDGLPRLPVGVADGGHPKRQRLRGYAGYGEGGQVDGDHGRVRRQWSVSSFAAPGVERGPVLQVFGAGGRGTRGIGEDAGGLDLLGREGGDAACPVGSGDLPVRHRLVLVMVRIVVAVAHRAFLLRSDVLRK